MTIGTDPPNDDLENHLQQSLEDDARKIPAEIASRLAAIRHEAVREIPEQRTSWFAHWQLVTAGGVAAVVIVAVLMTIVLGGDEDLMRIPITPDAEIAAAQELEILEELEFLAWLEEEDSSAG